MKEPQTNQEFLLDVIREAVDFNTQIMSLLTHEVAGDQSGKTRTHQKKMLADIQILGHNYNYRLESMSQSRENELRDAEALNGLTDDLRGAIRRVQALLDERMRTNPNQELASVANYLQAIIEENELPLTEKVNGK